LIFFLSFKLVVLQKKKKKKKKRSFKLVGYIIKWNTTLLTALEFFILQVNSLLHIEDDVFPHPVILVIGNHESTPFINLTSIILLFFFVSYWVDYDPS
jgi:hypothetical protein